MKKRKTLIMSVGISGSGKSTYFKKRLLKDFPEIAERLEELNLTVEDIVVCPDLIRKELYGDINAGHFGDESYKAWCVAEERLRERLKNYGYAVIDGINTHGGLRNKFVKRFKNTTKIAIVFRPQIDLYFERIQNDIKNNVDRVVLTYEAMEHQLKAFKNSVIRDQKWDGLWTKAIKEKITKNLTEERRFHEVRFVD